MCRGSVPFSADSVQESVSSQREGTLQCAVIFCFVHAASLHIDGIERGERGREGEQVRSAGCLSAPELPSLALSLSIERTGDRTVHEARILWVVAVMISGEPARQSIGK